MDLEKRIYERAFTRLLYNMNMILQNDPDDKVAIDDLRNLFQDKDGSYGDIARVYKIYLWEEFDDWLEEQ